ncbi:hypothetical protein SEA_CANDC_4 [Microbacterium phage CandC]|nr:hypothetical protein SEA_CANDC_4 [Microbacterium phage CandC]
MRYAVNDDVARMITRLASHGEITTVKVKAVARAQHRATPVAGRPTPWSELTYAAKQRKYAEARAALEEARP